MNTNTNMSQPPLNVTVSLQENFKHSLATGLSVGFISYNVGALFPEQAFQSPAIWATLSTMLVNYIKPYDDAVMKSAMIGATMAAACMFVTRDCPPEGAIRYGTAAAVAAYISSEFIVPRLLRAEARYI